MPSRSLPSPGDKRPEASEFRQRAWLERLVAAAVVICLCLVILAWTLRLWEADLAILPVNNDTNVVAMSVKSLVDNGWWLRNPHLGMPFGQQLFEVPFVDNLSMSLMKLLSLFTRNYAVITNLFFFLTFPLTAITSLFVLRSFDISYPSAIVASLLYVFLPYHFFRGEGHLFLSAYYLVPVIVMLCVWLWKDELDVPTLDGANGSRISRPLAFALLAVLLIGSGENYYAFFGCFLLCVAGVGGSFFSHRMRPLALAIGLSTFVVFAVVLNNAPLLLYMWSHGANKVAALRAPQESEIYGLKISQMLLPVTGHRLPYFSRLKDTYNSLAPEVNENQSATLGVVGGFGFLFLLASLLWQSKEKAGELFRPLATLTVAAVFLGTIGGFGSLFNFVVYPQFRCYNRISVYIAFLSLFTAALLLDALKRRMELRQYGTWVWYGSLAAVLLIGILDQTTTAFVPNYEESKAEDHNDAAFVKEIEAAVPRSAMIFQLPTVSFPTNPPVQRMVDYDLLKGYLHSNTLRWSYGSVKGREDALWGERVTHQPLDSMVQQLAFAGFSGIYIDRYGYSDSGRRIEDQLSQLLGQSPLVSENGRLAFFNLTSLAKSRRAKYTPEEWREKHAKALTQSIVGTPQGNYSVAGASAVTVNSSTGVTSGDLIFAYVGTQSSTNITVTTPTGWTLLAGPINPGTGINSYLFQRISDGTDGANYTFNLSGNVSFVSYAHQITYRGVNNTTPVDGSVTTASQTSGTSLVLPAVSPVGPSDLLVAFVEDYGGTGTGAVSGMTQESAFAGESLILDQQLASSGSTGTQTVTNLNSSVSAGFLFAVMPLQGDGAATSDSATSIVAVSQSPSDSAATSGRVLRVSTTPSNDALLHSFRVHG
jgi:hypothetical protein